MKQPPESPSSGTFPNNPGPTLLLGYHSSHTLDLLQPNGNCCGLTTQSMRIIQATRPQSPRDPGFRTAMAQNQTHPRSISRPQSCHLASSQVRPPRTRRGCPHLAPHRRGHQQHGGCPRGLLPTELSPFFSFLLLLCLRPSFYLE